MIEHGLTSHQAHYYRSRAVPTLPRCPRDVQVKAVSPVRKQQHIEYRVPATALLWLSVHAGGQASQAAVDARTPYLVWLISSLAAVVSVIYHCRSAACISHIRWRWETTHLVFLATP